MNGSAPLLHVRGLQISYGPIQAVRGVGLDVEEGQIVSLLGPNGAGKSSLLNGLVGLVRTSEGKVEIAGKDVTGLDTRAIVRAGMSLTPEGRRVFARLSVLENLRLGAGRTARRYDAQLAEVFELFPILRDRGGQVAGTLSGGEQQQLAIGRSLMSGPRVLLLDEPSLGLAPRLVRTMMDLIRELPGRGTTVLLVEQNVEQALRISDAVLVMLKGVIVSSGNAGEELDREGIEKAFMSSKVGAER
jgi:branched-chain amino acid transport system ATP-binding protein